MNRSTMSQSAKTNSTRGPRRNGGRQVVALARDDWNLGNKWLVIIVVRVISVVGVGVDGFGGCR